MMGKGWWAVAGSAFLVSVITRHNLLLLSSLLLALVGGASYLWTRYCLAGVSYRRRFGSTRLFHGDGTDLNVEIVNAKPLPLSWLRAEDELPAGMQISSSGLHHSHRPGRRMLVNLLSLRWYERVTRHYQLRGLQRGAWQFGPAEIVSGDIFGLDVRREHLPQAETVLVYPRLVPITALGLPARHPFGDAATRQRLMEDPLRPMGAREYAPGDSMRHIHWKASARQGDLLSRTFEPSAERPLAIFLNINTYDHIYEGLDLEMQEYAITAAASIARYAWEQGHQVGLYANSVVQPGGRRIRLRPAGHPDQLTCILEALAGMVQYGWWPIDAVLQVESPSLRRGTTVVVVTPTLSERLTATLVDLGRRQHGVVLVALGEAQLEVPLPGVRYHHIGGREAWYELESLQLA